MLYIHIWIFSSSALAIIQFFSKFQNVTQFSLLWLHLYHLSTKTTSKFNAYALMRVLVTSTQHKSLSQVTVLTNHYHICHLSKSDPAAKHILEGLFPRSSSGMKDRKEAKCKNLILRLNNIEGQEAEGFTY
jgi:hypothetical protein